MQNIPKILLVNDHQPTLLALETLLSEGAEAQEYEIITAQSGEEALRQVLLNQFAVILLDVNMPDMDGFETAELIHSRTRSASTPIIFITAYYADEMNRLKGYELGAVDFLITPIIPQILLSKIAVFVELSKKNLELQSKTQQLSELNQSLVVKQMQELKYHNEALQVEIEERRQAERKAHELATRDSLTGLINRRFLIESLDSSLRIAKRRNEKLAVLFLDMDRFKTINDTLGHDVGDQLLIQAAGRLNSSVREVDIVSRLGGDEFVIVLRAMSTYEDAAKIANKIISTTHSAFEVGPHAIKTSFSIGISLFPQDGDNAQVLMKNADLAMYHTKREKRGSVHFYSEKLNARMVERRQMEQELQAALQRKEFELFYQPKIEILTGRIAGLEALIRWNHPRKGLINSNEFIDTAMESGLIVEIGEWVIATACEQIKRWQDAPTPLSRVPVAINIAIPQVRTELADYIKRMLQTYDITANSLQLEITESLLIRDLDRTTAVLKEINESGITIAIDDFGTGYSSLSMLKALPIDVLKIDQSFVRHLEEDVNDSAIVSAIINMARALGLRVVAEGVETEAQLRILKDLECDEHQGFLYSEPLSAADLASMLDEKIAAQPLFKTVQLALIA
ncbi:MAG TPA: EAL domain-containing protein [Methylophilaceae bacterium]|nr:EAL domain-containing protein [Methylophilaceae bacterium]